MKCRTCEQEASRQSPYCLWCLQVNPALLDGLVNQLSTKVRRDLSTLGKWEVYSLADVPDAGLEKAVDELFDLLPVLVLPMPGNSQVGVFQVEPLMDQVAHLPEDTIRAVAYATQLAAINWRRLAQGTDPVAGAQASKTVRTLEFGLRILEQAHPGTLTALRESLQNS